MNAIVLCADTYRADHLSCLNSASPVATPNLDRLAAEGIAFTHAFGEGTPTLPARRVLYTGRRIFPFLYAPQRWDRVDLPGWHPLFHDDVTLAEWLAERGYITALISDLPHQFKPGKNFHRGFRQFEWVRGQEMDYYRAGPRDGVDIAGHLPSGPPAAEELTRQFLMNAREWRAEADWSSARVLDQGIEFLDRHTTDEHFLLWLEAFSPHEPWYAPPELVAKYGPAGYDGPEWIFPPGHESAMSETQAARVRAQYAALCELIDRGFGRLLAKVEAQGRLDDTVIVFLSDHGTMLGEQGQYHKGPSRLRWQCTQVPWLMRLPGAAHAGARVDRFVQHQDLMPTLLRLLGEEVPDRCTGVDLLPAVTGSGEPGPDHVVTSFGWYASVRTRRWNLQTPWADPSYARVPERQRQFTAPELYDLAADPNELVNVIAEHPDVAAELHAKLIAYATAGRELTRGSLDVSEAVGEDVPLFDQSRL